METIDDETVAVAKDFIQRQYREGKPWFVRTRMHCRTHVKPQHRGMAAHFCRRCLVKRIDPMPGRSAKYLRTSLFVCVGPPLGELRSNSETDGSVAQMRWLVPPSHRSRIKQRSLVAPSIPTGARLPGKDFQVGPARSRSR
jgi:hypothetical protein